MMTQKTLLLTVALSLQICAPSQGWAMDNQDYTGGAGGSGSCSSRPAAASSSGSSRSHIPHSSSLSAQEDERVDLERALTASLETGSTDEIISISGSSSIPAGASSQPSVEEAATQAPTGYPLGIPYLSYMPNVLQEIIWSFAVDLPDQEGFFLSRTCKSIQSAIYKSIFGPIRTKLRLETRNEDLSHVLGDLFHSGDTRVRREICRYHLNKNLRNQKFTHILDGMLDMEGPREDKLESIFVMIDAHLKGAPPLNDSFLEGHLNYRKRVFCDREFEMAEKDTELSLEKKNLAKLYKAKLRCHSGAAVRGLEDLDRECVDDLAKLSQSATPLTAIVADYYQVYMYVHKRGDVKLTKAEALQKLTQISTSPLAEKEMRANALLLIQKMQDEERAPVQEEEKGQEAPGA